MEPIAARAGLNISKNRKSGSFNISTGPNSFRSGFYSFPQTKTIQILFIWLNIFAELFLPIA